MNPDQLKQAINFDYQLMTFALGMHQYFLPISEKAGKISSDLIELAQKLGDFVHEQRKMDLAPTPVEEVN